MGARGLSLLEAHVQLGSLSVSELYNLLRMSLSV